MQKKWKLTAVGFFEIRNRKLTERAKANGVWRVLEKKLAGCIEVGVFLEKV